MRFNLHKLVRQRVSTCLGPGQRAGALRSKPGLRQQGTRTERKAGQM